MEHPSPPCTGTRRHWRPSERRNCERSAVCEHVYCGFEASRAALRSARWEGNEIAERAVRSCSVDTVARCGARDGARIRLLRFRTSMSRIEQRPRIVRTPGRCGRDIVMYVRAVLYRDCIRTCLGHATLEWCLRLVVLYLARSVSLAPVWQCHVALRLGVASRAYRTMDPYRPLLSPAPPPRQTGARGGATFSVGERRAGPIIVYPGARFALLDMTLLMTSLRRGRVAGYRPRPRSRGRA